MSRAWSVHLPPIACAGFAAILVSCAAETTVYRYVPEYQLREGIVPERYVREDGVVVINRPRRLGAAAEGGTMVDPAGREIAADGAVRLHALLPEQALSHMQQCLLESDWQLMWEQVISATIREEYEKGGGFDEFAAYMDRNRHDLYGMLNRMIPSIRSPEVIVEALSAGFQRVRFHWTLAKEFKFAAVDLTLEEGGLKVAMIHPYAEPANPEMGVSHEQPPAGRR
jgi:hypothetical protein